MSPGAAALPPYASLASADLAFQLRQERKELKAVQPFLGLRQLGAKLPYGRGIAFFGGQFGHDLGVIEHAADGVEWIEDRLQPLEGTDGLLGAFLVAPETGRRHLLFDFVEVSSLAGDVKESP